MRNQDTLITDSLKYFGDSSKEILESSNLYPSLYAVHVRPRENHIKSIAYLDRLNEVEDILDALIKKVQTRLIKKPTAKRNQSLLIRSRNFIESSTKYGSEDIHHSHGVWSIHPHTHQKFKNLLVPFDRELLNEHQKIEYANRTLYSFNPIILGDLSQNLKSVMIEEVHDLPLILDYCTKNAHECRLFNKFSVFDTPDSLRNKKKNNNNEQPKITVIPRRSTPAYFRVNTFA